MQKLLWRLLSFRILTLAVLLCRTVLAGEAVNAQQLTTVRASYDGTSGFNLPIWILESTDIGKRHGFDVKTFLVPGVQSAQAVIGGISNSPTAES